MIAKVSNDEKGQIIRMPKDIRIDENEVEVKKFGQAVVLMPIEANWKTFQIVHNQISKNFMVDGRAEDIPQEREKF